MLCSIHRMGLMLPRDLQIKPLFAFCSEVLVKYGEKKLPSSRSRDRNVKGNQIVQ